MVMLTDADVRRIAVGTRRAAREFVQFVSEQEISIDKRSPWWIRFGAERRIMVLRWKGDTSCLFLDSSNRCTIYDHRPVTCREHPFNVTLSDTGGVRLVSLSRVVDCEHGWDGRVTRQDLRVVQHWNDRQSDSYLQKVCLWNRRFGTQGSTSGFLRFLGVAPQPGSSDHQGNAGQR